MTIEAKIVCDSLAGNGVRLTTFILKYPRFIHSEFMTHRDFSRNASSSRAIPFERQLKMIEEDMAMPIEFRYNQKGMQAGDALSEQDRVRAVIAWQAAGHEAIDKAKQLAALGVHKQYVNRILEPFAHITVVVSSTRWANFFALRHHSAAQPEIAELARQMWEVYQANKPKSIAYQDWHIPFITQEDIDREVALQVGNTDNPSTSNGKFSFEPLVKMSVARCARVSYMNHEGKIPSKDEDMKLYDRLLGNQPIHASPAEHQAQPSQFKDQIYGNFNGWIQYRKLLEGEYIKTFKGPLG